MRSPCAKFAIPVAFMIMTKPSAASETIAPFARPAPRSATNRVPSSTNAQIAHARKTTPTIVQATRPRVQPPRRTSPTPGGAVACGCSTSGVNSCSSAAGVSCTVSLTRPPRRPIRGPADERRAYQHCASACDQSTAQRESPRPRMHRYTQGQRVAILQPAPDDRETSGVGTRGRVEHPRSFPWRRLRREHLQLVERGEQRGEEAALQLSDGRAVVVLAQAAA